MIIRKAAENEYKTIKKLYLTAFPADERAPFFFLKRKSMQKKSTMLIAESDRAFIGFAYTVVYRDLVYLFYFAVADSKRESGYGSEILHLLKEYYPGKRIFLAREQLDKNAENYDQRVRRHKFYLKNGFKDLPFCIKEASVVYDVMSCGGNVAIEDYNKLIVNWAGKFVSRIVNMKAIEKTLD